MMMRRGMHVDFLTFITPPHTSSEALEKTKKLAEIVCADGALENATLFVCDFSPILAELRHIAKQAYRIVLMRRSFMRIASALAVQEGYDAVVTGEALGQVASQTAENMGVIRRASPELLVLRPLVGMDKGEIVDRARILGTYETSIEPYPDACALFTPDRPVTRARSEAADELERANPYIDILTQSAVGQRISSVTIGNPEK